MANPIYISTDGLTRCLGCGCHIKVGSELEKSICPFCGEYFLKESRRIGVTHSPIRSGSAKLLKRGNIVSKRLNDISEKIDSDYRKLESELTVALDESRNSNENKSTTAKQ